MVFWDEYLEAEYEGMATDYKPSDGVEVLLIGESPPETEENEKPYFYNKKDTQGSGLSSQIQNIMEMEELEKGDFLEKFQEEGFYLIDIFPTYEALQRFNSEDESAEMKAQLISRLTGKVVELEPEKMVFIHKGAVKDLALPFPAYGNQPDFKEEFEQLIN